MGTYNLISAPLACPHCGVRCVLKVECKFGATANILELEIGDTYPWVPRKAVQNGGRPTDGTGAYEGYTECLTCSLDFFVDVEVREDRIVSLTPNTARPAYKTGAVPGGTVYFRNGDFYPDMPELDYLQRAWYSKHLHAMAEPSLLQPLGDFVEVYRFLWLRAFHHPIAVRVGHGPSGGGTIRTVELDGAGGYEPGDVASSTERTLEESEWDRLSEQVRLLGLWELAPTDGRLGADGSQWVLEGRRGADRVVVPRWSPGPGLFRDTGLLFLSLGQVKLAPGDVY